MYDHRKRFRSTVATEHMMIIEKQTQKKNTIDTNEYKNRSISNDCTKKWYFTQ